MRSTTVHRIHRTVGVTALLLVMGLAGCGDFLTVANEQDLADGNLNSIDAIGPLLAGVAGDFAAANTNGAIITGLLALEFRHVGSFPSWRAVQSSGVGSRPSSNGNGMFNDFAGVEWVAVDAIRRFRELQEDPARSPEIAEAIIWQAFTYAFLADNFCSAVFAGGSEESVTEVYQRALASFEEALGLASAIGDNELRLRALSGRARIRLFQGDYSGALADAGAIPAGWSFDVTYTDNSAREYNDPANMMRVATRKEAGVHPRFYEDPLFISDPRMPFTDFGPLVTGADITRQFVQQEKYVSRGDDMPLANWQEARLIMAEANLRLGNLSAAVELIDELRTRPGVALAPYAGPMTDAAIFDQILFERSVELWIQGRLLKDMRRSNNPLLQGRDTCFEIGTTEWDSNPNLGG